MNHQLEHKARSAELHRRKALLNRDLSDLTLVNPFAVSTTTTQPTTTSTSSTKTSAPATSTSTTASVITPATSATQSTTSKTSSSSSSSTTTSSSSSSSSSTSTTSSISSSSSASSATSTSAPNTSTVAPNVTSRTTDLVTFTPSASASLTGSALASSSTSSTSGGVGAGSIVGAIFGTIGGILVVAVIVAFIVRRVRKRNTEEEHFDAAQFRRSAALLDDEFGNDNNFSARPPTMIARHMAHAPTLPPVSYGNYPSPDPYAADPYATPGAQFNTGDPYNQYNNGYPAYTQDPVYTLNRADSFPPSNPIAHSGSAGSAEEMDPTTVQNTYLNRQPTLRENDTHAYPAANANMMNIPQQYLDMNRVASPPGTPSSATPLRNPHDAIEYPSSAMHNPHDDAIEYPSSAAPLHNPHDAIEYPSAGAHVAGSATDGGPGPEPKRPDTVYDPEDAYGGM